MAHENLRQVSLGNSGLESTVIGYGTYHLREKLGGSDAIDSLARAFDAGITFFDTSDNYGTEDLIGLAIAERALLRDEVVIATKTGLATSSQEYLQWSNDDKECDTSPARIRKQVDKSLRMFGAAVDVIDLCQLHAHDPLASPHEVAQTMNDLIDQGKIRAWGVSNYDADNLAALLAACDAEKVTRPVSSQPFHNVVKGSGEEAESAWSEGLTVLAHSPLLKGMLADSVVTQLSAAVKSDARAEMQPLVRGLDALVELRDYAKARDLTLAQFAIAWASSAPNTVVLSACTSEQYLQDALRGVSIQVDRKDPELVAIQGRFAELNFANIAANIMRQAKIYYR